MGDTITIAWDAWHVSRRLQAPRARHPFPDSFKAGPGHRMLPITLSFRRADLGKVGTWIVEQMARPAGMTMHGIDLQGERHDIGLRYYPDLHRSPSAWIADLVNDLNWEREPTKFLRGRDRIAMLEAKRWPPGRGGTESFQLLDAAHGA